MAKKMTIEDIRLKKKKLQEKEKKLIAQRNEKIGKLMCKEFGFKSYTDFEQWLAENSPQNKSKNVAKKVDKKSNMSGKNKKRLKNDNNRSDTDT